MSTQVEKAQTLARLHAAPEILRVPNVWDVVSAKTIAALPETRAIATAGHSIAATFGYPDGEKIPLELMLDMVGRIVEAVGDLPVSADLDAGYGDAGETVRRAIGVGVVGANVEDRLQAARRLGRGRRGDHRGGRGRGRALRAQRPHRRARPRRRPAARGVHRRRDRAWPRLPRCRRERRLRARPASTPTSRAQLVEGIGERKVSVIGVPGNLRAAEYEALGIARISYGPTTQRVALTALQDVAIDLYADGVIPSTIRALN